ncbi:hypothetical protein E2C01_046564 [Portunus trituberculatus]|uniref:Uncharacterized protein n=1 Tax=Portunus trituberculatus TaxID=210409 RepID=A0A5B7G6H8_PORTR|nr:hypothetical protein [Portunus trituberculatus]
MTSYITSCSLFSWTLVVKKSGGESGCEGVGSPTTGPKTPATVVFVIRGVPGDQRPVAEAGLRQPKGRKNTGEGGGHGRPAHTSYTFRIRARWSPSPLPITSHTPENVQLKGIDESAINSALASTPQEYLPLNATLPAPTPHTNTTQHNTTPYLDISGGEGRRPQDTMKYRIKHKQSHFAQTARILTLQWFTIN